MIVLGIDTALEACSVGIADAGRDVLRSEIIGRGHAERLFGMIEEAMAEAEVGFSDIDRYAVTTGPGSFTGVRVGIAAVRGFALVSGAPAIGVSTLAVHAETARGMVGARAVLAALPAKGGEVFAQLFGPAGEALTAPAVGPAEAFAGPALEVSAALAGAGAPAVGANTRLDIAHTLSAPEVAALLRIAFAPIPGTPPRPLYIKPPDAVPAAAR
jgi:tRNA threonylcarbamoyl adenosine modification protein YeaZ